MTLLGTFEDMSLTDLIEIFRMGAKSGILTVDQAALRGTVVVSMGRLIDAEVVEHSTPPLQVASGDNAVLEMLRWPSGDFNFAHDLAVLRHPVKNNKTWYDYVHFCGNCVKTSFIKIT